MSGTAQESRQFGEGPLSRISAWVYNMLVIEALLLLAILPGLVPLVLLDRDASNIPLAAACALPFGPAVSAALYALHRRRSDLADLHPAAAFWRGYRLNVLAASKVWLPQLLWLTVVGVNLGYFSAAGVPGWWAVLLIVLAVLVALAGANALVIVSLFEFRTVDVARLSVYFLVRRPRVTIGTLSLLVVAAGVTVLASEAVLALLGSLLALALLRNGQPMVDEIRREFTA